MAAALGLLWLLQIAFVVFTSAAAPQRISVKQLIGLVRDPAVPPLTAVSTVLATGRLVKVNSSRDLWEALNSGGPGDALIVELQRDLALDDPVWEQGVVIPPGRSVILRSKLNTSRVDVTRGAEAIARAGAARLSFAHRAAAIVVRGGSILGLDGLQLVDIPSLGAWLASKPPLAYGFSFSPGMLCDVGCMEVQRATYTQAWNEVCSDKITSDQVYRAGLLVGNTSAVVKLNGTAFAFVGGARFELNLLNSTDLTQPSPGKAMIVARDGVFNCLEDPTLKAFLDQQMAASAVKGSEASSRTPAWVWALVAVGGAAVLTAILAGAVLLRSGRWPHVRRPPARSDRTSTSVEVIPTLEEGKQLVRWDSPYRSERDQAAAVGELPAQLRHLREAWHGGIGRMQGVELLEPIGRGGSATVWKARWRGTLVAAKLIEHSLSDAVLDNIQREASLSTGVSHPNVVTTYRVATVSLEDLSQLQPKLEVGGAVPATFPPAAPAAAAVPAVSPSGASDGSMAAQAAATGCSSSASDASAACRPPSVLRRWLSGSRGTGKEQRSRSSTALVPGAVGSSGGGPGALAPEPLQDLSTHSAEEHPGPPAMGATVILQELCMCSVEDCMRDGGLLYRADGSPDQVAALRMLLDVALGLDYLLAAGIVHGDVKPANVLLASTGCNPRGWQAKVADLGLSRMLPPDATSMAAAGGGTLAYTAPEALSGRLTRAADVYSFGIMMYEVWTRQRAWEGMQPAQMVFAVTTQHARPQTPPGCPEGYASLMQRCWAHSPEHRPTFSEVIGELHAMVKRLSQRARAASPNSPALLAIAAPTSQAAAAELQPFAPCDMNPAMGQT